MHNSGREHLETSILERYNLKKTILKKKRILEVMIPETTNLQKDSSGKDESEKVQFRKGHKCQRIVPERNKSEKGQF